MATRWTLVVLFVLACAGGCSGDPSKGTVHGEVTLDKQPLKEGLVKFVGVDDATLTADAPITDGRFQATVPVGQMRVQFHANKVVGKQKAYDTDDSPVVDVVQERIPARFNTETKFTITVKPGSQQERFELASK
jgi:hypothetical protein